MLRVDLSKVPISITFVSTSVVSECERLFVPANLILKGILLSLDISLTSSHNGVFLGVGQLFSCVVGIEIMNI